MARGHRHTSEEGIARLQDDFDIHLAIPGGVVVGGLGSVGGFVFELGSDRLRGSVCARK